MVQTCMTSFLLFCQYCISQKKKKMDPTFIEWTKTQTFFKISSFIFHRRKEVTLGRVRMWVNDENFHFWVNWIFNSKRLEEDSGLGGKYKNAKFHNFQAVLNRNSSGWRKKHYVQVQTENVFASHHAPFFLGFFYVNALNRHVWLFLLQSTCIQSLNYKHDQNFAERPVVYNLSGIWLIVYTFILIIKTSTLDCIK